MTTVISVENLSKTYKLGQIGTGTLTNDLKVWWAKKTGQPNPLLKIGQTDYGNQDGEILWALKDISFQVQQGEVLGIIGRNGAGKSTLLKILSRVTAPTSGQVKVKGRIASLLEVGTGFHPELTGRENIFLNGAILGMSRQDVHKKFDEIVNFAEVEKFIDTPVKRYSSGMYVRLAFAVAAYLNSDILVVDEVLAVGDIAFQKKCLGKMSEVSKGGRSVLFVSHNLASIKSLCDIGFILAKGQIIFGPDTITETVDNYNKSVFDLVNSTDLSLRKDRKGSNKLKIINYELFNKSDIRVDSITCGEFVRIRLHYLSRDEQKDISVAISFGATVGDNKLMLLSEAKGHYYTSSNESGYFDCVIPKFPLTQGSYLLNLFISSKGDILDWIREVDYVDVVDGDFYQINKITNIRQHAALVEHYWE